MSNAYTWLMSKDKMYINGVSSDTVGIFVDTPPMPPMAEEIVEEINIIGRAESNYYHTGTYKDITITVNCYIFDYGDHPDLIYKYLRGAKTLSFSSADDYYYKVKRVAGLTPSYNGKGKNTLSVQFICSPFKYAVNQQTVTFQRGEDEVKTVQVFNAGGIYSEPVFLLPYGSEETHQFARLWVNGEYIATPQTFVSDVYIDLQIMEVYRIASGAKVKASPIYGNWWDCLLLPGYNTIEFAGCDYLTIKKNERLL